MIIIGGEPPFVEKPEPRFGQVVKKLNEMKYVFEEKTHNYSDGVKQKLDALDANINDFVNTVLLPTQAHLKARGPVHGENASAVGLGKKDNYRAATLSEQTTLADVDAWVTPAGAKAALEANGGSFAIEGYQRNDLFQFSSYYFPDEYPTVVPTRIDPVRYFGADTKVGVMINADRLVFSPVSDASVYSDQTAFVSMPMGPSKRSQLAEIANLKLRYLNTGWNTTGGLMSDGTVAFFRPLANKQIYQFRNGLALGDKSRNFILFRGYGSGLFKGLGVGCTFAGQTVELSHRFFQVNGFDTDPVMEDVVGSGYSALFDLMGKAQSTGPLNGSHSLNILDYLELPSGATATIGGQNTHGVVLSLFWNLQDYELNLHICIPVTVTRNGKTLYLSLNVVEAIVPGTLVSGGSATVRTVGTREKDVINDNLGLPPTPKWVRANDLYDFNNPLQSPGAVVDGGEVVKSVASKYGVRVRRFQSGYANLRDWLLDLKRPAIPPSYATNEFFAPGRHSCFSALPERILPVSADDTRLRYLVYGLDSGTGRFKWTDLIWTGDNLVSVESSGTFGVRPAEFNSDNPLIDHFPAGLVISTNKAEGGVGWRSLVFTKQTAFRGVESVSYTPGELVTKGKTIALNEDNLKVLQGLSADVLLRGQKANPSVQAAVQELQVQVYAVSANKALVLLTDGVAYAEAAVAGYRISGSECLLDYTATSGLKLVRVSEVGLSATGRKRQSSSGDGVWSEHSDLFLVTTATDSYQVGVTRPFGDLYGDLSFTVSGLSTATPAFAVAKTTPAKLYGGTNHLDVVDEVYPLVSVPGKGLYQTNPTNTRFQTKMTEVGGTVSLDPFDINEAGWVRMPAGGRAVLNGRTYVLDRDYSVQVPTSGVAYCYLVRIGDQLSAIASPAYRQPNGGEVLFGIATDGVLKLTRQYIVMDNKVMSATRRHGSAIPCFINDGGNGPNNFFTKRDITA